MYKYDKDKLKNSISLDKMFDFMGEMGAEPRLVGDKLFCKTICHCGESHKLYYYDNTKLFKCFTDCGGDAFDIYELVCRNKNNLGELKTYYTADGLLAGRNWEMYDAIEFVATYFGFTEQSFDFKDNQLSDWKILENYKRIQNAEIKKKDVELEIYDESVLKYMPHPEIMPWIREGITQDVMESRGICFNPKTYGIIIPHYDINGNLRGIRERTLIKENEKYGKYRPSIIGGKMYNHPLGFNLYNLNNSKEAIKLLKKAIVFEGEKSPLLYASYFGKENDISVACCGSSLINYQVQLLLDLGVEEIVVAFDKQFQEIGDKEWEKLTKNLYNIHDKYGRFVQISYMFDKEDRLGYKMAPIDAGPDIFMELYKERVTIE